MFNRLLVFKLVVVEILDFKFFVVILSSLPIAKPNNLDYQNGLANVSIHVLLSHLSTQLMTKYYF